MVGEHTTSKQRRRVAWRKRETVTVDEAAMILGISRNLAYDLARAGELGSFRAGHRYLVSVPWLKRQIDRDTEA